DARCGAGLGLVGHDVRQGAGGRGHRRRPVGPPAGARGGGAGAAREPRLPARGAPAGPADGDRRRRGGRRRGGRRRAGGPVAEPARQPRGRGAVPAADCRARQPHEGRGARHDQAHERGHRRGRRRAGGAGRRGLRAQPGQGDRRRAAGCHGRRLLRPGGGGAAAGGLHDVLLPALHQRRRRRLRARRGGQERHRPRDGDGRGDGLRRQHQGLAHHPRSGRDRSARRSPGRRPHDLRRARGAGRPGRHLLLTAVAQPHLRREARSRRHARAAAGAEVADRRGRQVVPVHPRPGPQARRLHADHRAGRGGRPRGQHAGRDAALVHDPRGEERV
ncbi:MAG: Glycerol-3-phosphate dehydrogenase [NAD(P)+], partial [uncultured Frankineae bacterium]